MTTPPTKNVNPESKRYFWMALSALALTLLMFILFGSYDQLPNQQTKTAMIAFMIMLIILALVLVIISLIKMRHKALPIITLLILMLPVSGFFCCGGGLLAMYNGFITLQGNNPALTPKPKVEWDSSPSFIVVQVAKPLKDPVNPIKPEYLRNYIPDVRLWGDGRIVISECRGFGDPRVVYEGRLTAQQMAAYLKQAVDYGFFGWHDNYFSYLTFAPPLNTYLTINLLTAQKTVTSSLDSAPPAYNLLIKALTRPESVNLEVLDPPQGILIAIPTTDKATINWDGENLNVDLSKASEGIPTEGKILHMAWNAVNLNPYNPPAVTQNGKAYILFVEIPGLMYQCYGSNC